MSCQEPSCRCHCIATMSAAGAAGLSGIKGPSGRQHLALYWGQLSLQNHIAAAWRQLRPNTGNSAHDTSSAQKRRKYTRESLCVHLSRAASHRQTESGKDLSSYVLASKPIECPTC